MIQHPEDLENFIQSLWTNFDGMAGRYDPHKLYQRETL